MYQFGRRCRPSLLLCYAVSYGSSTSQTKHRADTLKGSLVVTYHFIYVIGVSAIGSGLRHWQELVTVVVRYILSECQRPSHQSAVNLSALEKLEIFYCTIVYSLYVRLT